MVDRDSNANFFVCQTEAGLVKTAAETHPVGYVGWQFL